MKWVEHVKNHYNAALDAIVANGLTITEEVDALLIEACDVFTKEFVRLMARGSTPISIAVENDAGRAVVKIPQLAEARGWKNAIDLDILALMTTSQQDAWSSHISNVAAGGAPDAYIHMKYTLADQDTKSFLASLVKEGLAVDPSLWAVLGTGHFANCCHCRFTFKQFIKIKSREAKQIPQAADDGSCIAAAVETPTFFCGGMFTGPGVLSRLTDSGTKLWRLHEEYPIQEIIGTAANIKEEAELGSRAGWCRVCLYGCSDCACGLYCCVCLVCSRYCCGPCTRD